MSAREIPSDKGIVIKNWGKEQIELAYIFDMRPKEFHIKEDGTKDGEPSLAILFTHPIMPPVVGQISLRMLEPLLDELNQLRARFSEK